MCVKHHAIQVCVCVVSDAVSFSLPPCVCVSVFLVATPSGFRKEKYVTPKRVQEFHDTRRVCYIDMYARASSRKGKSETCAIKLISRERILRAVLWTHEDNGRADRRGRYGNGFLEAGMHAGKTRRKKPLERGAKISPSLAPSRRGKAPKYGRDVTRLNFDIGYGESLFNLTYSLHSLVSIGSTEASVISGTETKAGNNGADWILGWIWAEKFLSRLSKLSADATKKCSSVG